MRSIEPRFAAALLLAALTIITVLAGHIGNNPYFLTAAAAFLLATYATYPPAWLTGLAKLLPGANPNDRD